MKILMLVPWEIYPVEEDDKKEQSANILVKGEKYWFFKHWPDQEVKVDVIGYKKIPIIHYVEKKWLHFYIFCPLRVFPLMKRYDLVICFHSQIGLVLALLKSLLCIDIPPLVLIDVEGLGRKHKWWQLLLLRRALSSVSLIFYLASIQREDYAIFLPKVIKKTRFLPLGVDFSRYVENKVEVKDYIISIGYEGPRFRDWKTLIRAFSLLRRRTKLLIVGKKKFSAEDIGDYILPKGIEFVDRIDLYQLNELTVKSRFVVLSLPEYRHAYAQMTLLGCMALGKAVIVSRVYGIIDYVIDGKNAILVESENEQDLSEKIEYLLSKPQQVGLIGQRARETVKRFYTEEGMAQNIFKAIQRIFG